MKWVIELALAGLGRVFLHYGIIGMIILAGLAAELALDYFAATVPFVEKRLKPLQKDILWAMAIAAFGALMMWVGGTDQLKRCIAKQSIVSEQVHSAVTAPHVGPLNGDSNE